MKFILYKAIQFLLNMRPETTIRIELLALYATIMLETFNLKVKNT